MDTLKNANQAFFITNGVLSGHVLCARRLPLLHAKIWDVEWRCLHVVSADLMTHGALLQVGVSQVYNICLQLVPLALLDQLEHLAQHLPNIQFRSVFQNEIVLFEFVNRCGGVSWVGTSMRKVN